MRLFVEDRGFGVRAVVVVYSFNLIQICFRFFLTAKTRLNNNLRKFGECDYCCFILRSVFQSFVRSFVICLTCLLALYLYGYFVLIVVVAAAAAVAGVFRLFFYFSLISPVAHTSCTRIDLVVRSVYLSLLWPLL